MLAAVQKCNSENALLQGKAADLHISLFFWMRAHAPVEKKKKKIGIHCTTSTRLLSLVISTLCFFPNIVFGLLQPAS